MAKTTRKIKKFNPNEKVKSRVKRLHKDYGEIYVYKSGTIKSALNGQLIKGGNNNPKGKGGENSLKDYSTRDIETIKSKIEYACKYDAPVREICSHAEISQMTLYKIFEDDPDFMEHCTRLKEQAVLAIRINLVEEAKKDPKLGLQYLERKRRSEFATSYEHKHNHTVHQAVEVIEVVGNDPQLLEEARNLKK